MPRFQVPIGHSSCKNLCIILLCISQSSFFHSRAMIFPQQIPPTGDTRDRQKNVSILTLIPCNLTKLYHLPLVRLKCPFRWPCTLSKFEFHLGTWIGLLFSISDNAVLLYSVAYICDWAKYECHRIGVRLRWLSSTFLDRLRPPPPVSCIYSSFCSRWCGCPSGIADRLLFRPCKMP